MSIRRIVLCFWSLISLTGLVSLSFGMIEECVGVVLSDGVVIYSAVVRAVSSVTSRQFCTQSQQRVKFLSSFHRCTTGIGIAIASVRLPMSSVLVVPLNFQPFFRPRVSLCCALVWVTSTAVCLAHVDRQSAFTVVLCCTAVPIGVS